MPLDLDLTVRREEGEGSPRGVNGETSVALEINSEVVPVVFETSRSDDGVQEETAKMMVCSA
jgi:hypothetical protein